MAGGSLHTLTIMIAFAGFITLVTLATAAVTPGDKLWWAHRITDDFYTSGRPTVRQLKYAADVGFKSIISNFYYVIPGGDVTDPGQGYQPTTAEARVIVEDVAGLAFAWVMGEDELSLWTSLEPIRRLHGLVRSLPRPILHTCNVGFSSTFHLMAHFANVTAAGDNMDFEPDLTVQDVVKFGFDLGYDYFTFEGLQETLQQISNVSFSDIPSPILAIQQWYHKYWPVHVVSGNWIVSGTLFRNQTFLFHDLSSMGFVAVVNVRRGDTSPPSDVPSQEEVALLNIRDRTGTYDLGGRQSRDRLEATRIDPDRAPNFISNTSPENYEASNILEFGDSIGYSEAMEREYMLQHYPDIPYYHMPIGAEHTYTESMWETYKEDILSLAAQGPVLIHSATGKRASVLAILGAAQSQGKDSSWALERARVLGYSYGEEQTEVENLFNVVLGSASRIGPQQTSFVFVMLGWCYCYLL